MEYGLFKTKQNSIIIRISPENPNEFEAYVQECPTIRAYGKTKREAWANCVYLTLNHKKSDE